MTVWLSRADWGARPPKSVSHDVHPERGGFAIHYSGSDSDEQADHANCGGRVRAIQRFHMEGNGWQDLAYNWIVDKHGYVFEGRGWGVRSAAQGTTDGNDSFLAICFLGDDTPNRDDVTDAGRQAIRDVIVRGWAQFGVGKSIRPHSSFKATSCPGDQLRAWIVAGLPGPTPPPTVEDIMDHIYIRRKNSKTGAVYRLGPILEHVSGEEWAALPDPKPVVLEVGADSKLYRRPKLLDLEFDPEGTP